MKWRDKYGRSFLDSNKALQGNIVDLVQIIEKGSTVTPFLISLGGTGSFVKITYGNMYT